MKKHTESMLPVGPTQKEAPQLPSEVVDLLESIAQKRGISPCDVVAEAFGKTLVLIDSKIARRLREIEIAADIEPGSVLESLVEPLDSWSADFDELEDWIFRGWEISDPGMVSANLRRLSARWQVEDAKEKGGPGRQTQLLYVDVTEGGKYMHTNIYVVEADSQQAAAKAFKEGAGTLVDTITRLPA